MGAAHHICWLEYCFLPFTLFCKLMPPLEVYTLHLKAGSHPNAGLTSCVQNNLKNSLWVWTSVLELHFSHHFPPFHIKRKHKIEKIVQKREKWPKNNNLRHSMLCGATIHRSKYTTKEYNNILMFFATLTFIIEQQERKQDWISLILGLSSV